MLMEKQKRRDEVEITYDVLKVVKDYGKIRKTRLMQLANLTTNLAKKYLTELEKKHLISKDNDGFYFITEKGRELLEKLEIIRKHENEIKNLINEIKKSLR